MFSCKKIKVRDREGRELYKYRYSSKFPLMFYGSNSSGYTSSIYLLISLWTNIGIFFVSLITMRTIWQFAFFFFFYIL